MMWGKKRIATKYKYDRWNGEADNVFSNSKRKYLDK